MFKILVKHNICKYFNNIKLIAILKHSKNVKRVNNVL